MPCHATHRMVPHVMLLHCSDKERARGDHEAWGIDADNNIGYFGRDGKFVPKYR